MCLQSDGNPIVTPRSLSQRQYCPHTAFNDPAAHELIGNHFHRSPSSAGAGTLAIAGQVIRLLTQPKLSRSCFKASDLTSVSRSEGVTAGNAQQFGQNKKRALIWIMSELGAMVQIEFITNE